MKRACLVMVFVISAAFALPVYADQDAAETLKAVVKIRAIVPTDARTARSLGTEREGSGVVIDSNGHVLTIGYLIVEAETIQVTGPEGKPINASFVGYDHNSGFGLLRTEKPLDIAPMKLGQSADVTVGAPILVASHQGADSVQSARVVSRSEFAGYWEYLLEDAIFTTPPHPDFGGAALIGPGGRLVGIGSLYTQVTIPEFGTIPCNMFVPIDLFKPILADLIATGRSRRPPRPWLGLHAGGVHGRVFVLQITSGGPAEEAGLRPGDIILAVDKETVTGLADFLRKVWALGSAGVTVPLRILQGTEIRNITVRSADRYRFLQTTPKKIKSIPGLKL